MTASATLWVLNLDAELELDRARQWLAAGRSLDTFGYQTTKPIRQLMASPARHFASTLPPRAVVLADDERPSEALNGRVGCCWCPTPSAIAKLRQAGATAVPAPSPDVLLKVNHRRYCAGLGQTLPAAQFVETVAEINALLSQPSPTGEWLCKRPLGFAGRGQRRIAADQGVRSPASESNQRWLTESVPRGGLQIEPYVEILAELSLHGLVQRDGRFALGQVCQQQVDEHRAWTRSTAVLSCPLSDAQRTALHREAEHVAVALASEGYFGPFSVDSYLWQATDRGAAGAVQLNPRSEINARMTMAYPTGMGEQWHENLLNALRA